MSISLQVEGIAGTSEDAAVDDIRTLSDRLGIMVWLRFNGVMMLASPGEGRDEVRDRFKRMQWADEDRQHRERVPFPADIRG